MYSEALKPGLWLTIYSQKFKLATSLFLWECNGTITVFTKWLNESLVYVYTECIATLVASLLICTACVIITCTVSCGMWCVQNGRQLGMLIVKNKKLSRTCFTFTYYKCTPSSPSHSVWRGAHNTRQDAEYQGSCGHQGLYRGDWEKR